MIAIALLAQTLAQVPASGIAITVPPTHFACDMTTGDGSRFSVAGTTPEFPAGWDPNRMKFVAIESPQVDAFQGKVGIDPGDASDWFREFQVSGSTKAGVRYTLQLMLRREGTSVAHSTRYESTGKPIPYEYHAAGLCRANFAPAAADEGKAP